jgi:hypothetical protein
MSVLYGLQVRFEGCRDCCSNVGTIESSGGTELANLICSGCGVRRGTISGQSFQFLSALVERYGAPDTPIILRRGHVRPPPDEGGTMTGNTGAHQPNR